MARRSYGKARQSTPITDSVKLEQRGGLHDEQGRQGLEQGRTQSSMNSISLSLSLKVRDWKFGSLLMFCFDSGEREQQHRSPYCFLFSFFLLILN